MNTKPCPVCNSIETQLFREVGQFPYFECMACEVIFIAPDILAKIDAGEALVNYTSSYWNEELYAARERSWGSSLARVAEVFLYARSPIQKFLDIGSGPGYLLDALQYQLPSSKVFYANELYPPDEKYCTANENYLRGSLADVDLFFDSGCCIEVIEHLTPSMVRNLFKDLALKSRENSTYIFNTGLSEYVKKENVGYLDPTVRGHIISWSVKGLQTLVAHTGFEILPIRGKSWAFIAEYKPNHSFEGALEDRIWHALPENVNVLKDNKTGQLMYILGIESARAYT